MNSLRSARVATSLLLLTFTLPGGQTLHGQEPDSRGMAVEEGIFRGIQVRGMTPDSFTILERMEVYDVPGVSVAVMDEGRIVWAKGFGFADVESGTKVSVETLFQAASISKPVAAMAALRLVEEGRLSLDAPVNDYLKEWKIPENQFTRDRPVTLRHLMTHTGGLTVHGFPGYSVSADIPTTVQVLDGSGPANTGAIRVDTVPGDLWRYSGGGYTILQKLLEDVTDKPFEDVLRKMVLDPAGMTSSSYEQPLPPSRSSLAATAHGQDGSPAEGKWHLYPEMAAAGLWTNPTELAKLAMDVQASGRGEGGHILSPEMTKAQLTPGLGGWGLGFGVAGEGEDRRFSHGGANHGFRASFTAWVHGGRGVFIMTNGDRGSPLAQEIALAVAREFEFPYPSYREVTLVELPAEALGEIAGDYMMEGVGAAISVTVEGTHLRVTIPGGEIVEMHPLGEDSFIDLVEGNRFRVERSEEGLVTAIQLLGGPRATRVEG